MLLCNGHSLFSSDCTAIIAGSVQIAGAAHLFAQQDSCVALQVLPCQRAFLIARPWPSDHHVQPGTNSTMLVVM